MAILECMVHTCSVTSSFDHPGPDSLQPSGCPDHQGAGIFLQHLAGATRWCSIALWNYQTVTSMAWKLGSCRIWKISLINQNNAKMGLFRDEPFPIPKDYHSFWKACLGGLSILGKIEPGTWKNPCSAGELIPATQPGPPDSGNFGFIHAGTAA